MTMTDAIVAGAVTLVVAGLGTLAWVGWMWATRGFRR